MSDIISIGGHSKMTPAEALDVASRIDWENIVIIGSDENENYVLHCSEMTRAQILYFLETAKLDMMRPALRAITRLNSQE